MEAFDAQSSLSAEMLNSPEKRRALLRLLLGTGLYDALHSGVQLLDFRVQLLDFRVQLLDFRVQLLDFRVRVRDPSRMTNFAPWIRPTLMGPFITTWGFVTLSTMTFGVRLATLGQYDDWLLAMLSVSMFAGLVVTSLVASDVFLLQRKVRQLPTGASVWLSSLLAPVGIWFAWHFLSFGDGSIPSAVLHIVAPIVLVPFTLRLLFGRAC